MCERITKYSKYKLIRNSRREYAIVQCVKVALRENDYTRKFNGYTNNLIK